jgi:molybdopterin-guanine dinucleotide biosynthesis protein A
LAAPDRTLGVLLAGGRNRRYGSNKALETIDGIPLIDRALRVLDAVCQDVVIVANETEPYEHTGRQIRPDSRPGTGVLGGILTALQWANETDHDAALVLACDMPFVPPGLLAELVCRSGRDSVSIAESEGPRGMEPLCAVYGVGCVPSIEQALDRGERAVVSFFADVQVCRVERTVVEKFGRSEKMFFNMNRPDERSLAEELARSSNEHSGSSE